MALSVRPTLGMMAATIAVAFAFAGAAVADVARFVGSYSGSAEVVASSGDRIPRDMSVTIAKAKDGFTVQWTSVTYREDGRSKEKSYSIDFVESERDAVYAAAQKKNIFGHLEPLDPMKGEPYAWARINDDTMTVYSLFVDEDGGYSLQKYDRTLADGGLNLRFQVVRDGEILRAVETFLKREE